MIEFNLLTSPGEHYHRSTCPQCYRVFDLENRKPFRKVGGCRHSICGACIGSLTGAKECPVCTQPSANQADKEWTPHEEMIELLPTYHELITNYNEKFQQLQPLRDGIERSKNKLTLLNGVKFVLPVRWITPKTRPGYTRDWREGPFQLQELRQAITQLQFDTGELNQTLLNLGYYGHELSDMIKEKLQELRKEEEESPYDKDRSVMIKSFRSLVKDDDNVHEWIDKIMELMEMEKKLMRRKTIKIVAHGLRTVTIEFETEDAKNKFKERFNKAMGDMFPGKENRHPDVLDL